MSYFLQRLSKIYLNHLFTPPLFLFADDFEYFVTYYFVFFTFKVKGFLWQFPSATIKIVDGTFKIGSIIMLYNAHPIFSAISFIIHFPASKPFILSPMQ